MYDSQRKRLKTFGFQSSREDERARLKLVAIAASVGVVAAVIFVGWPRIDLTVSSWFNLGPRHFLLSHYAVASDLRLACDVIIWVAGATALIGIVFAIAAKRYLLGLGIAQWLVLALVLSLGPGLVANVVLKDHWRRPRPTEIVEFGGPDQFTPVLERSGQCERNCSFVCGEASSIYALGFAVAMLARRRRAALMGLSVIAGSLIGVIRIAEGAHFLSDVIFAAVFMAMIVALLHWLISHPSSEARAAQEKPRSSNFSLWSPERGRAAFVWSHEGSS